MLTVSERQKMVGLVMDLKSQSHILLNCGKKCERCDLLFLFHTNALLLKEVPIKRSGKC